MREEIGQDGILFLAICRHGTIYNEERQYSLKSITICYRVFTGGFDLPADAKQGEHVWPPLKNSLIDYWPQ
jgi:hypothetical protein